MHALVEIVHHNVRRTAWQGTRIHHALQDSRLRSAAGGNFHSRGTNH